MTEVLMSKPREVQQNSKSRQGKDFLKLNMQNLRRIQKDNEIRKMNSPNTKCQSPRKPAKKQETFLGGAQQVPVPVVGRLKAGGLTRVQPPKSDNSKLVKKSPKKSAKTEPLPLEISRKDKSIQACSIEDESFLKGAKIIEPSVHIIAAITHQKATKMPKPNPAAQTRKFEKHSAKLETHLDNLKEFMERGSISRRRKNLEKKKEEAQKKFSRYGIMTESYSTPTTKFNMVSQEINFPETGRFKYPRVDKISQPSLENGSGDRVADDPKKLVVVYQRE